MGKFLRDIAAIFTISAITFVGGVNAAIVSASPVSVDSSKAEKGNSSELFGLSFQEQEQKRQRSFFASFKNFFPFRISNSANDDKLLSNVKVFPNPVAEQINLSFRLNQQHSVAIKVMDALGNEVMTLLDQQLDAGNQNHSFDTNNKLTNGFYFIRVSAGTETVVKRISVL